MVFLYGLVCNLLVERQILSIPHKFSFLEYDYFVAMREVSIIMQVINKVLAQMFRTYFQIHMGYGHISFHHVLFGHHIHAHIPKHILYLRTLCCARVHPCHGLLYRVVKY